MVAVVGHTRLKERLPRKTLEAGVLQHQNLSNSGQGFLVLLPEENLALYLLKKHSANYKSSKNQSRETIVPSANVVTFIRTLRFRLLGSCRHLTAAAERGGEKQENSTLSILTPRTTVCLI